MTKSRKNEDIKGLESMFELITKANLKRRILTPAEGASIADFSHRLKEYHPLTHDHALKVGFKANEVFLATNQPQKVGLYGGFLEDIGLLNVPIPTLDKKYGPGRFGEEDKKLVRRHPLEGYKMLMTAGLSTLALVALYSHRFQLRNPFPSDEEMPTALPSDDGMPALPSAFVKHESIRTTILFQSRLVSLADQYVSYMTPNPSRDKKPLTYNQVRELMVKENPDQEYLLSSLFKEHIF